LPFNIENCNCLLIKVILKCIFGCFRCGYYSGGHGQIESKGGEGCTAVEGRSKDVIAAFSMVEIPHLRPSIVDSSLSYLIKKNSTVKLYQRKSEE